MLIEEVKKLSPIERWLYWITERSAIRLKKEANKSKPWTDDTILQSFRFCNVRRMDDKVSQWLLKEWYVPHHDNKNMLMVCALARFVNNPATLEQIEDLLFRPMWQTDRIAKALRSYRDKGNTIFNGAYMVRGNNGIDKIDSVVNFYVEPLKKIKIPNHSMELAWKEILPSFGLGSFMAGQIVADLRHAVTGRWGDRKIWAPKGPGSLRGLNRLLERPLKAPMSQDAFLAELGKLIALATIRLPSTLTGRLEAIDWQNTLCEYDKYSRALLGEGRLKQLYKGAY